MNAMLICSDKRADALIPEHVKCMAVAEGVSLYFVKDSKFEPATKWTASGPDGTEEGWWPVFDTPPIEARALLMESFVPKTEEAEK